MSNRTAEASKAVRLAWGIEQMWVKEGKGTRDWTPEQQRDILTKGRAYDEDGKAFEGHHMMSAERYPEYQGDAGNIQFLSREEHFEAHNGSFQNPTHGYYDFVKKETIIFPTEKYTPCKVIELSDPIVFEMVSTANKEDSDDSRIPQESNLTEMTSSESIPSFSTYYIPDPFVAPQEESPKGLRNRIRGFMQKHPKVTKAVGIAAGLVTAAGIYEANKKTSSSNSNNNDSTSIQIPQKNDEYDYSFNDSELSPAPDETISSPHSSPIEHEVTAHKQRYHTKNGVEWRDKDPYPRGGKKED